MNRREMLAALVFVPGAALMPMAVPDRSAERWAAAYFDRGLRFLTVEEVRVLENANPCPPMLMGYPIVQHQPCTDSACPMCAGNLDLVLGRL